MLDSEVNVTLDTYVDGVFVFSIPILECPQACFTQKDKWQQWKCHGTNLTAVSDSGE